MRKVRNLMLPNLSKEAMKNPNKLCSKLLYKIFITSFDTFLCNAIKPKESKLIKLLDGFLNRL